MPAGYEAARFSGALGRYRKWREQRAVGAMVDMLPSGITVLDCPCGIGRWWPILLQRATEIRGVDISPAMLDAAKRRTRQMTIPVKLFQGDAEDLDFSDGSLDAVFSHALMKHLPLPVQHRVLAEFSRVTRHWVICSFSILNHLSYEFWRRRHLQGSYPVLPEQLAAMAGDAGLIEVSKRRCTTPIGVEYSVLFRKLRPDRDAAD